MKFGADGVFGTGDGSRNRYLCELFAIATPPKINLWKIFFVRWRLLDVSKCSFVRSSAIGFEENFALKPAATKMKRTGRYKRGAYVSQRRASSEINASFFCSLFLASFNSFIFFSILAVTSFLYRSEHQHPCVALVDLHALRVLPVLGAAAGAAVRVRVAGAPKTGQAAAIAAAAAAGGSDGCERV